MLVVPGAAALPSRSCGAGDVSEGGGKVSGEEGSGGTAGRRSSGKLANMRPDKGGKLRAAARLLQIILDLMGAEKLGNHMAQSALFF